MKVTNFKEVQTKMLQFCRRRLRRYAETGAVESSGFHAAGAMQDLAEILGWQNVMRTTEKMFKAVSTKKGKTIDEALRLLDAVPFKQDS